MGMWTIPDRPVTNHSFTDEELDLFSKDLARLVCQRKMAVPAIMTLELAKPVSFVGANSMLFFTPLLELIFDKEKLQKFHAIAEDRKRLEQLITNIETFEKQKTDVKEGESRD